MNTQYLLIESKFCELFNELDVIEGEGISYFRNKFFSDLVCAVKGTEIINTYQSNS
ncbi:hypothetical protein LCGC14_2320800 [marine sediment metagenome]|uniref:Uncharacterized protein n=1 Tax=marine sediment metagenome TaxID=412755 RepID=A0A0F9D5D6_9ZZZZ